MEKINQDKCYNILINNKDVIVLDLRANEDYKNGHIIQAININPYEVVGKITKISNNKKSPIIVYCYNGAISLGVSLALTELGYKYVYDLETIEDWKYNLYI